MDDARTRIIISSVFFVLGFSTIFAALGVLLQSALSGVAYDAQNILRYVGGAIIIFFGLLMMGIVKVDFLQREHKLKVKKTRFQYVSSFLFGGAFAVGWTPCVGAVLGAVLTLAATQPQTAFPLMLSYSIGLGVPFIIAAIFISQAKGTIKKLSPYLHTLNLVFGAIIVILGIMVATGTLSILASQLQFENIFFANAMPSDGSIGEVTLVLAFLAGIVSFLSPCILPIVPAYLTFIAGTSLNEAAQKKEVA
ncbi:MAG: cytochrome c biogenesis protein CcdA [archaeon]|nr:cytochrome c biogenesis protein CcdA [archaeon]